MRKLFLLITICCISQSTLLAQTPQKAQKQFVHELNSVLQRSSTICWAYTDRMSIDSAFAIDKEGILSVTVRYKTDTSFYRVRMEVPINKITSIVQDLYLILECENNTVKLFTSDINSEKLLLKDTIYFFHCGELPDGDLETIEKIRKVFEKMK